MPTGYTDAISKGITFNQFIMRCARAFGACIDMRDDPTDKEIPERFEPSDYHIRSKKEAEEKLELARNWSMPEIERLCLEDYAKKMKNHHEYIADKIELKHKYEAMLADVYKWQPPTPDHEGLKYFMIEQITGSIDFDCDLKYWEENAPVKLSAEEWYKQRIDSLEHDIGYHQEQYEEEVERTENRNTWLKQLRQSLQ